MTQTHGWTANKILFSSFVTSLAAVLIFLLVAVQANAEVRNGAIAFTARIDIGTVELHLMHPNGVVDELHTRGWSRTPEFSPDGREVAFSYASNTGTKIYAIDVENKETRRLTLGLAGPREFSPTWSPGGDAIGFSTNSNEPSTLGIRTFGRLEIEDFTPPNFDRVDEPAWAPDDTDRIAFSGDNDNDNDLNDSDIWVYDPDPNDRHWIRITRDNANNASPTWSPDGRKLAFSSSTDGGTDIWEYDFETRETSRLTENGGLDWYPAWSPDGKKIAFASLRDGNYEIYVMDADGGNQTRKTFTQYGETDPTWQPLQDSANEPPAQPPNQPPVPNSDEDPAPPATTGPMGPKTRPGAYRKACNLRVTSPRTKRGKKVRITWRRARRLFTHGAKGYVRWGKVAGKPVRCEKIRMLLLQKRGSRYYVPGTSIRVSKKSLSIKRFARTVRKLKRRGIGRLRQKRVARKRKTNTSFKDFNRRSKRGKRALSNLKKKRYRGTYVFVYTAIVDGKTIKKQLQIRAK